MHAVVQVIADVVCGMAKKMPYELRYLLRIHVMYCVLCLLLENVLLVTDSQVTN